MATENETVSLETHTAAVAAARAEGHAAGLAEGKTAGAAEATARIGAILGSDEAKANASLAAHFAFKTSMSAEDAKAALTAAGHAAAPGASAQTIEQRAAGLAEFGAPNGDGKPKSAAADDIWKKAAADANRSIGAV